MTIRPLIGRQRRDNSMVRGLCIDTFVLLISYCIVFLLFCEFGRCQPTDSTLDASSPLPRGCETLFASTTIRAARSSLTSQLKSTRGRTNPSSGSGTTRISLPFLSTARSTISTCQLGVRDHRDALSVAHSQRKARVHRPSEQWHIRCSLRRVLGVVMGH